MNENEAHPRAAALLADAGWKPHPTWGVFTRGTLVMGGDLMGGFHVKDWGLDLHGPDTPDTAEEAAAWLVQRFAIPADVVTLDYAPEPEQIAAHDDHGTSDSGAEALGGGAGADGAGDDAGRADGGAAEHGSGGAGFGDVEAAAGLDHDGDGQALALSEQESEGADRSDDVEEVNETHGETGEEAAADDAGDWGVSDSAGSAGGSGHGTVQRLPGNADDLPGDDAEPVDADFSDYTGELPEIELIPPDPDPDFGAELLEFEGELTEPKEEAPSGAFIFGDNLDQKRTAAIGLVVQIALQKMPAITPTDDARLAELRNFTLGVSEGRWANDPSKQAELEGLELIASLARQVEATRDAKVAFLVAANREQIEAFDPEAGWP